MDWVVISCARFLPVFVHVFWLSLTREGVVVVAAQRLRGKASRRQREFVFRYMHARLLLLVVHMRYHLNAPRDRAGIGRSPPTSLRQIKGLRRTSVIEWAESKSPEQRRWRCQAQAEQQYCCFSLPPSFLQVTLRVL